MENSSEISYAEVLYKISVPTFVINKKHTVIHWNRAIEILTGLPAVDVVGTSDHWRAFYPSKITLQ